MFYNLTEKQLDSYIYRIVSLERLLEIFVTKQNTLVKPALWEDTFENFILKSKIRLRNGEVVHYNIHERMYGQCWTLDRSSDAMWRIYSPNKEGIRIRTTVRKLLNSLSISDINFAHAKCCIGKVEYLYNKELMERANSTFDESGISVNNIFKSLLIKRKAFKHENEVRLLYDSWSQEKLLDNIFSYHINPHALISQIMIDPRRSYSDFQKIKNIIKATTGYKGQIKRSLLYKIPKDKILNTTDDFAVDGNNT